jgi:hypothetical protein
MTKSQIADLKGDVEASLFEMTRAWADVQALYSGRDIDPVLLDRKMAQASNAVHRYHAAFDTYWQGRKG